MSAASSPQNLLLKFLPGSRREAVDHELLPLVHPHLQPGARALAAIDALCHNSFESLGFR